MLLSDSSSLSIQCSISFLYREASEKECPNREHSVTQCRDGRSRVVSVGVDLLQNLITVSKGFKHFLYSDTPIKNKRNEGKVIFSKLHIHVSFILVYVEILKLPSPGRNQINLGGSVALVVYNDTSEFNSRAFMT